MAESSWPSPNHNSRAVTDAEYEQLAEPAGADGVIGTPANTSVVYADDSGMLVKIRADKAAIVRAHRWSSGGVDFTRSVTSNASGLTRVDLVVLKLTRATWDVTTVVKAGTPGSGAPALTQDLGVTGVFEIPLATVTVPSGDSSIGASQVTRSEYYLGALPIVCTSITRPGHAVSQRIWETDTAREYVSNGTDWIATYEDTGNISVSPGSGWALGASGHIRVRRRSGWVFCSFDIHRSGTSLTAGSLSTLFTVPTGYRPTARLFAAFDCYGSTGGGRVDFAIDGTATISSYDAALTDPDAVCGSAAWPV